MSAMSRREVLALAGATLTAAAPAPLSPPRICIFSKHLQWLNVADAARLAADIGPGPVRVRDRAPGVRRRAALPRLPTRVPHPGAPECPAGGPTPSSRQGPWRRSVGAPRGR